VLTLDRINVAVERAKPYVIRAPLLTVGDGRFLKLESLQPTGSYKVRGFFAAALNHPREELERGLLTVSAGNAALAAAYVAHTLGVACRVVMPDSAPAAKLEGVRRLGAEAVLLPRPELVAWITDRGWLDEPGLFIHPFADEEVMAGHAGIALELLQQAASFDRVLVPVGGGGLITGLASALKATRPDVEVVGVQSEGYPLWRSAVQASGPVSLTPATIADGTTAPFDAVMFSRLQELVDRWVLVPEAQLRSAVKDLAASAKVVAEGAGALAYAAQLLEPTDSVSVAILSGGNIDSRLLSEILAESGAQLGN
jgi:threonine dehydratase